MALLEGKVAIVTGAGGGIGRSIALLFAREGARVVVNDLGCARDGTGASNDPADRVVSEIIAAGGEAVASYDSVATSDGAKAVVTAAVKTFGGVDVAVCNAAILRAKSVLKTDEDDFDAVMSANAKGTFLVAQAAARQMVEQRRGGRIVTVTGAAGLVGNLGQSAYSAACAAVVGLTRTLAIELKKHDGTPEDAARHDPTDELAAFKLALEPWPGKFGVYYENKQRPTKNALEQKLIAATREKHKHASDLELLQKTFARMR